MNGPLELNVHKDRRLNPPLQWTTAGAEPAEDGRSRPFSNIRPDFMTQFIVEWNQMTTVFPIKSGN